ncbi:MAG: excinuclease ABC subunit UvrC [Kiritimatiellae bacterium]|nr:excinuclease ABC subunit UvrC [Kiritimatiellia bacterium]
MNSRILEKLRELPRRPGCYVMRNRKGEIIYVGKAKILANRVRSYFRHSTILRGHPKVRQLVREADSIEWTVVRSEDEALLLENRLINEHQPKYNILLRDDKRYMGIKGTAAERLPRLLNFRLRRDDGAHYFGPFPTNGGDVFPVIDWLSRRFGLRRCGTSSPDAETYRHCNDDLICTCSAPCIGRVGEEEYRRRFEDACDCLRGKRIDIVEELRQSMLAASAEMEYEKAGRLKEVWLALREMGRLRQIGHLSTEDEKRKNALDGLEALAAALNLPGPPHVIECFDISNTLGKFSVASMTVAVDGIPDHRRYRIFNIEGIEGANDPASIAQAVTRRYGRLRDEGSPMPDLVILDGGITQLRAARAALGALGIEGIPTVGLAERLEELVLDDGNPPILLDRDSQALNVVRALRDEAHRFGITRHRKLRNRTVRESILDDISGIGHAKKMLLLRTFGSVRELARSSEEEIAKVPGIGSALAAEILRALASLRSD